MHHLKTSILVAVASLTFAACGGRQAVAPPAPSDPTTTVRQFLSAVSAQNLTAMGALWGSQRGPAANWMERAELEKRLTVIEAYLAHERYELVGENTDVPATAQSRILRVRMFRKGCTPVVPFTMQRYRGGWLVTDIDLGAAGNPERSCTRPSG